MKERPAGSLAFLLQKHGPDGLFLWPVSVNANRDSGKGNAGRSNCLETPAGYGGGVSPHKCGS